MVCNRARGSAECCPNQACSREAMKTWSPSYLAIVTKQWEMLCSILSPGEIEILKVFGEKRMNAEIARLKGEREKLSALRAEVEERRSEIERRKFALRTLAAHERAKLSDHMLSNYCRRGGL